MFGIFRLRPLLNCRPGSGGAEASEARAQSHGVVEALGVDVAAPVVEQPAHAVAVARAVEHRALLEGGGVTVGIPTRTLSFSLSLTHTNIHTANTYTQQTHARTHTHTPTHLQVVEEGSGRRRGGALGGRRLLLCLGVWWAV